MKLLKWTALSVIGILLLSGCYTQLEYSQRMNRITESRPVEQYNNQDDRTSQDYATNDRETSQYADNRYDEGIEDDYIPLEYKDYETASFYNNYRYSNPFIYGTRHYRYVNEHALYSAYKYGYLNGFSDGSGYIGPPFYTGYYGIPLVRPFSYDWYMIYGRYYRAGYSFAFWWSYPHHSFYHHSHYYSYIYGPFAWPYRNYITYNFYYFGQSGSSYSSKLVANRRYGPRSIGTNRVSTNRTRSADRTRNAVRSRSANTSYNGTRTRSAGRTRGTVNRTSRTNTRSRSTGRSVQRTRNSNSGRSGNGTVDRNRTNRNRSDDGTSSARVQTRNQTNNSNTRYRTRNGYIIVPRSRINRSGYNLNSSEIQSRLKNSRVTRTEETETSSFWKRLRNYMNNSSRSSGIMLNRMNKSNSSINYRFPKRSVKSGRSSSVKRSSSSSSSRSRSGSSSKRSRSSGNDNSSSRSRGGN